jgi:hypothetical protein
LGVAVLVPLIARQFGYAISPLDVVLLPVMRAVHGVILLLTGW